MSSIEIDSDLVNLWAFYCALLAAKMLPMGLLTARQRFSKKVFANKEDADFEKDYRVAYDDPDVERVRRAHLNDMENIFLFFAVSALYMLTSPGLGTAKLLLRVFVAARYIHTVTYLNEV